MAKYQFLRRRPFLQTTQRNLGIAISTAGAEGTAGAAAATRESCEKGIGTIARGTGQHGREAETTQESWPLARHPCTWPWCKA